MQQIILILLKLPQTAPDTFPKSGREAGDILTPHPHVDGVIKAYTLSENR